jgi:hypothetical protein
MKNVNVPILVGVVLSSLISTANIFLILHETQVFRSNPEIIIKGN